MQIHRQSDGSILLNQQRYIEDIIHRFNLKGATTKSTPLPPGCNLIRGTKDEETTDQPYLQALGSLMYAMLGTQPDLAYAVGLLSQFSSHPLPTHWQHMMHVFRYLIGTSHMGLLYKSGPTTLTGYSHSALADDTDNSRSTAGHTFLLAGAAISWSSCQQSRICKSSAEAEYLSLSTSGNTAVYHRSMLLQLGFQQDKPTTLYGNNKASQALATNGKTSYATCHIRVDKHLA